MRENAATEVLPSETLVGASEIAQHLGVSVSTVWRWVQSDASFARCIRVRKEIQDRRLGKRLAIESTRSALDSWRSERPKYCEAVAAARRARAKVART